MEVSTSFGLDHWDGAAWTTVFSSAFDPDQAYSGDPPVLALWGSAADDVWAVGAATYHWDGSTWTSLPSPAIAGLTSIWGSARDDVWGIGPGVVVVHWDGSAWSTPSIPFDELYDSLSTVTGSSAHDVWFGGGPDPGPNASSLLHWNGSAWDEPTTSLPLTAIWCAGPNDLWGIEEDGVMRSTTRTAESFRRSPRFAEDAVVGAARPVELPRRRRLESGASAGRIRCHQ